MLSVPMEETVDERWILVIALEWTQALEHAYNLNTQDRDAESNLYRYNKGKRNHAANQNYGVNQETLGLLDDPFVALEQFTLVAADGPLVRLLSP